MKSISCRVYRDTPGYEWQRIVEESDSATFFHSPCWYDAMSPMYPGGEARAIRFEFDDGRTALFPCYTFRRPWRPEHVLSGPGGCYGGWLGSEGLGPEHQHAVRKWAARAIGSLTMRANPFSGVDDYPASWKHTHDTTEVLYLERFSSAEDLMANYKHSVRKQINKAVRSGVRVRAARDWADWESYFGVYARTLARWGDRATSSYPLSLFRGIREQSGNRVVLWIVEVDDRVVGGNLNFYHRGHAVEWHAAYDPESLKLGARNYTVHQILLDALRRGSAVYDFNPSGGHEGAQTFKRTFGTTSLPAPVLNLVPRRVAIARGALRMVRSVVNRVNRESRRQ